MSADQITRDIAAKCSDDVAAAMKRNMALVDTAEAKLSVSLSAASRALGGASGTYLALHDARDQPPVHPLAAADGVWRTLRPMVLKAMADIHATNGIDAGEWFPSPNPFAPVHILPADRDALYGGLISAGHPAAYARHMAYDMADDDGSLQMLARHRLAHTGPLDQAYMDERIGELMRDGGFWRACSGCQESVDGRVSTKDYPYSPLFRCQPGSGCRECGGIGVVWDDGRGYADITGDEEPPVEATEAAPTDEELDRHLPDSISAAKRCGIQRSNWMTHWFVPWSPRNENQNAEGPWSHWVSLANAILAADQKARAAQAAASNGGEA